MNIHIPVEIQKKWIQFAFCGKPFIINGKTYFRAKWKNEIYHDFWYCIEDDAAYFDRPNLNDTFSLHS